MDPTELTALLDSLGAAETDEAVTEILAGLTGEQLAAVQAELTDTIRSLAEPVAAGTAENPDADMETVRAAQALRQSVTARLAEVSEASAAVASEAGDVLATLEGDGDEESEDDDAEAEEAPGEPETTEAPAEEESVETEVPELVNASANPPRRRPVALGSVAANRTRQPEPTGSGQVLTASGMIPSGESGPGFRSGHQFADQRQFGAAMANSWRQLTDGQRAEVAHLDFSADIPYRASDNQETNFALLNQIRQEAEAGEAILASGGICAPGTPIYDFFSVSSRAGLLELPPVLSERGSLIFPVSPGVADLLAEDGIATEWTVARDTAGEPTKPVFTPACVETRSCEIIAWATRLAFGNFNQVFYPEFVAHLTSEAMITHDHKVDIALLDDIAALATLVQDHTGNVGGGTLVNLSHILGFIAAWYRNKHRMDPSATIEALLPAYVRDAAAADYVARNATVDLGNAYGAVDEWFRQANLRVQWLANLGSDFLPTASYPAAEAILYAPGTVVRQTRGSLNLGVVRDSTLNGTNDFQTFEETFDSACLVGNEVVHLTGIDVCPTGVTGEQAAITCWTGESS